MEVELLGKEEGHLKKQRNLLALAGTAGWWELLQNNLYREEKETKVYTGTTNSTGLDLCDLIETDWRNSHFAKQNNKQRYFSEHDWQKPWYVINPWHLPGSRPRANANVMCYWPLPRVVFFSLNSWLCMLNLRFKQLNNRPHSAALREIPMSCLESRKHQGKISKTWGVTVDVKCRVGWTGNTFTTSLGPWADWLGYMGPLEAW